MELRQLEHFLAVVEEGTFTRAAERLFLTQPAVSLSIKKLEEEVGGPLFARDVHDLSLTEAGRVLADYARRMVRLRDDATREMARLGSMAAGSLTVAAHEAAAVYLLPVALRTYVKKFPDIKVGIYRSQAGRDSAPGHGSAGGRRLREGSADVPRAPVRRRAQRRDGVRRLAASTRWRRASA